jgi:hypothetical protein
MGRQLTPSPGINYNRRWLFWCGRILYEGFELIKGLDEIILVEMFKGRRRRKNIILGFFHQGLVDN